MPYYKNTTEVVTITENEGPKSRKRRTEDGDSYLRGRQVADKRHGGQLPVVVALPAPTAQREVRSVRVLADTGEEVQVDNAQLALRI